MSCSISSFLPPSLPYPSLFSPLSLPLLERQRRRVGTGVAAVRGRAGGGAGEDGNGDRSSLSTSTCLRSSTTRCTSAFPSGMTSALTSSVPTSKSTKSQTYIWRGVQVNIHTIFSNQSTISNLRSNYVSPELSSHCSSMELLCQARQRGLPLERATEIISLLFFVQCHLLM
jgi:hypothetical protein